MKVGFRMSDILIRGMKIPKEGYLAFNIYPDGRVACNLDYNCALAIELPPHGRLGDLDALGVEFWKMRSNYQMMDDTQTADKIMHGLYRAEQIVKEAKTIISASE